MIEIFIGSSEAGRQYAELINQILLSAGNTTTLPWWNGNCFPPNSTPLESLETIARRVDAAIMVVTRDDQSTQQGVQNLTSSSNVSSNVMLEYGIFLGYLGRSRLAIVQVKGARLPSNLDGINCILCRSMQDPLFQSKLLTWRRELRIPSRHLQAIYERSSEQIRVIIPRLTGGTMTAVEGLAFGWLLKALSPMMKPHQRIDCLMPSPNEMFNQGSATFLIGSPSTNEQIRSIIARWYHANIITEATQDYSDIITYNGREYRTQFANGMRSCDFSFLIYRSEYEYFVCTGTSSFGAAGAVSMVTEPHEDEKVKLIHQYINERRSFVAIGEVEINSEIHWAFQKVLEFDGR
jgi:hypothetical protein